jgi:hypothetical protein
MAPKKKQKRVFEYRGPEADEIVARSEAPKKAERKKVARTGRVERDQPPAASRDGRSISERRLAEAMDAASSRKRLKQSEDDKPEKRKEPAAVKRLRQLQGAEKAMEPAAYQRALGAALKQGLQEQRAEAVQVAKRAGGRQLDKNRAHREKKKQKKRGKQGELQEEREAELRLRGRAEHVPFGEVAQAPPPMDRWVARLEGIRVKMKQRQAQAAREQAEG